MGSDPENKRSSVPSQILLYHQGQYKGKQGKGTLILLQKLFDLTAQAIINSDCWPGNLIENYYCSSSTDGLTPKTL